ncbi:MAG: glycoside hydrolase family 9 protein [Acetanaerobacterium sp.]
MIILTNHMGYDSDGIKKAVFQGEKGMSADTFDVIDYQTGKSVFTGSATECGEVRGWKTGCYWTLSFDTVCAEGTYFIKLKTSKEEVSSFPFEIQSSLLGIRTISAVGYYFKAQRSTGEWLYDDTHLGFKGPREGVVDAHGGWYDATGDYGIHLSHLSHSTYFNPQQAAFSSLVFFRVHDLLEESKNQQYSMVKRRMLDEGFFGADFVMRMRAPSGSFFRSINRVGALDAVAGTRKIGFEYHKSSSQFGKADTSETEIISDANYESSFRSGAGTAIAALAAAARHFYTGTDYTQLDYIMAAKQAYAYLENNNEIHTNNGKWNVIDEYCALDALVELYKTTSEYEYLDKARGMSASIIGKLCPVDAEKAYLAVEDGSDRPYFSAADSGLPVVALLNYASIETEADLTENAVEAAKKLMKYEIWVTNETANPFGYARQLIQDKDGTRRTAFFFPHTSEVEPWWQGENARIASLSTAARLMAEHTDCADFKKQLESYADDQLNWILGLNPFDSCMIEGYGRNNIQYFFQGRYDFMNCPGGICNGITSDLDDEEGIGFVSKPNEQINDNWRWAEQWIPHASWYLYAVAMKKK